MRILLLLLLLTPCARAQQEEKLIPYMPPSGSFACDLPPMRWESLEERSARGVSVRLLGPAGARLRPSYQIHLFQKDAPGYVPIVEALKKARSCEGLCTRETMPMQSWRVSERAARLFEVRETRRIPQDALPAEPVVLHHFYAFLPAGEDYFVVKLTVDEEEFQVWRVEFRRFLRTFRIIGRK